MPRLLDSHWSSKPVEGGSLPSRGTNFSGMKFFTDKKRHLVCVPYSIENLHKMATFLNINRCWFHNDHYDIPKRRIQEIEELCEIISSKEIVKIIKSDK